MRVRLGVEVMLSDPGKYLDGLGVGLITNPTGVTGSLVSTIDGFHEHPEISLRAIFGPEHSARGDAQDAVLVESYIDEATGLPVHSLYGEVRRPTERMLRDVDALVFDIQDVGARFYTYASTLTFALEAAAEQGIPFFVLDRPNPLNGVSVEGSVLESGYESFVGLHSVPIRHGLTIGELALLANERIGAQLEIVPMESWERTMWFDETGLPWVQPSPNIPTPETAAVYPGTCLFEGVNISEGRGTTHPFELVGAPWIEGRRWAVAINDLGLPGARFRACHFTPTFSKYQGFLCGGVQLHLLDRDRFRPVETALHMLSTALDLRPTGLKWLPPSNDRRCHFDLLAGTDRIRLALTGKVPVREIVGGWREALEEFEERRKKYRLYPRRGV